VRRNKYVFFSGIAVLLTVGCAIAVSLAHHPKLESFKLLNIAGLSYDFLGLVVLSEMVASSDRWKNFVVRWVAGLILWGQTVVPLGAAMGAWISGSTSSAHTVNFFPGVFGILNPAIRVQKILKHV
jgi:hypothetical protein